MERAVGNLGEPGISEAEWRHRCNLEHGVFDACGVELMEFNDATRCQEVVVVLRAARDRLT